MFFNQIKFLFRDAVFHVVSHMSPYLVDPDKDFTRRRKLPPETLISFLVSQGASSTGNELDDFFDFSPDAPSLSALNQQRNKIKPQALEEVFRRFDASLSSLEAHPAYRLLAADGSSFSFSVLPGGLLMSILFHRATPLKDSTVSTSMHFMTWIPILIRMPSSSLSIPKMNSGLSVPWWTAWRHLTGSLIFLLLTADTALIITWHMS